ncbi:MAG: N-acetylmuramic acid 6-phosphate etherase [Chloroflexota bacterium]
MTTGRIALDLMPTDELLTMLNDADRTVPDAVAAAKPAISRAVEAIAHRLSVGGRLIYVGAGTSGRLAALDAAECPPTFGVPHSLVQAVLAGGETAMWQAVEGAEDDRAAGAAAIDGLAVSRDDAVVGIAASAATPFTVAALSRARELGALTVALGCRPDGDLYRAADIRIAVAVGDEVLRGSTRLRAGTAQKLVLNMISTAVMTRLGHVYDDLMVDVAVTNDKLRRRAVDIVAAVAGTSHDAAANALVAAGDSAKTAIVMLRLGIGRAAAEAALAKAGDRLRSVIG